MERKATVQANEMRPPKEDTRVLIKALRYKGQKLTFGEELNQHEGKFSLQVATEVSVMRGQFVW